MMRAARRSVLSDALPSVIDPLNALPHTAWRRFQKSSCSADTPARGASAGTGGVVRQPTPASARQSTTTAESDMLVDENRIPIGIDHDETGWTRGALNGFARELDAFRLETSLQLTHVGEVGDRLGVLVPARVERQ